MQYGGTSRIRRNTIAEFRFETSSFNSLRRTELNTTSDGFGDGCRPAPRAPLIILDLTWGLCPRLYAAVRSTDSKQHQAAPVCLFHRFAHCQSIPFLIASRHYDCYY